MFVGVVVKGALWPVSVAALCVHDRVSESVPILNKNSTLLSRNCWVSGIYSNRLKL